MPNLEDKALRCIEIVRELLPNACEDVIEDQSSKLMFLQYEAIQNLCKRMNLFPTGSENLIGRAHV